MIVVPMRGDENGRPGFRRIEGDRRNPRIGREATAPVGEIRIDQAGRAIGRGDLEPGLAKPFQGRRLGEPGGSFASGFLVVMVGGRRRSARLLDASLGVLGFALVEELRVG